MQVSASSGVSTVPAPISARPRKRSRQLADDLDRARHGHGDLEHRDAAGQHRLGGAQRQLGRGGAHHRDDPDLFDVAADGLPFADGLMTPLCLPPPTPTCRRASVGADRGLADGVIGRCARSGRPSRAAPRPASPWSCRPASTSPARRARRRSGAPRADPCRPAAAVEQPRRERVAAADAVEDLDVALRDLVELAVAVGDRPPAVGAGRARRAQRRRHDLDVGERGHHLADHLAEARGRQVLELRHRSLPGRSPARPKSPLRFRTARRRTAPARGSPRARAACRRWRARASRGS